MKHIQFFVLAAMLFCPTVLSAEEIPVDIKADNLKYISGSDIVVATGSVEVKIKEAVIKADILTIDSATNLVTAEGHVTLKAHGYTATADLLTYHADTDLSIIKNFSSGLTNSEVKGEVFATAAYLEDRGDYMPGKDGTVTTCGYGDPHYDLTAKTIDHYPGDKTIASNAVLYVGEAPVLWLPYLVYGQKRQWQKKWEFGHNNVEGDYLKTTWDYPAGTLYVDTMEKKGWGYGTLNDYALLGLGAGSLYLYHIDEKDTGLSDWVTKINHKKQINQYTTLGLSHSYITTYLIPSGRRDQTEFSLDLTHRNVANGNIRLTSFDDRIGQLGRYTFTLNQSNQGRTLGYDLNYSFSKKSPEWLKNTQRLSFSAPLIGQRLQLSTKINYNNATSDRGQRGDERLDPEVVLSGRETDFSWQMTQKQYIDLDGNGYTGDNNLQYLEKLPELIVTPNSRDVGPVRLSSKFSYGRFHEVAYVPALLGSTTFPNGNRDFTTERYTAKLDASKSIPLGLGTTVDLSAGLEQRAYTPGDQLYVYNESLRLNTELFGWFRNNVSYGKGYTMGNTPFLFDQVGTKYNSITESMGFYYLSFWAWNISGGHNWQSNQYNDVMTDMSFRPNPKFTLSTRTGWSIEERKYRSWVNGLTYSPHDSFGLTAATVTDLNNGEMNSGSLSYDLYFLKGQPNQWHLTFNQVYDAADRKFKVRDIMLVKDLHCWELKYTYSDYRKEFSIMFTLKALPDMPSGFASGKGGFYVDGVDRRLNEIMKEIKSEGEVRRY